MFQTVLLLFVCCLLKYVICAITAACIALVDEMNWKIGIVDKKSTLQVGSFRIDSSGNQKLHEVSTVSLC